MIKTIVQYETNGKIFPTLEKALEYREGLVEQFLRNAPGFQDIPHKLRVQFVQYVLDNRVNLTQLLDYSEAADDDDWSGDSIPWH